MGKNWRIWRIEGHSPIFIRQCFFLGSVLVIHVAHSPILYPPIDSDQRIRQCFTPPKFSHVRYTYVFNSSMCNSLKYKLCMGYACIFVKQPVGMVTSCWMSSLITMFLTLSSNSSSDCRVVKVNDTDSSIFASNNRSTCYRQNDKYFMALILLIAYTGTKAWPSKSLYLLRRKKIFNMSLCSYIALCGVPRFSCKCL